MFLHICVFCALDQKYKLDILFSLLLEQGWAAGNCAWAQGPFASLWASGEDAVPALSLEACSPGVCAEGQVSLVEPHTLLTLMASSRHWEKHLFMLMDVLGSVLVVSRKHEVVRTMKLFPKKNVEKSERGWERNEGYTIHGTIKMYVQPKSQENYCLNSI